MSYRRSPSATKLLTSPTRPTSVPPSASGQTHGCPNCRTRSTCSSHRAFPVEFRATIAGEHRSDTCRAKCRRRSGAAVGVSVASDKRVQSLPVSGPWPASDGEHRPTTLPSSGVQRRWLGDLTIRVRLYAPVPHIKCVSCLASRYAAGWIGGAMSVIAAMPRVYRAAHNVSPRA